MSYILNPHDYQKAVTCLQQGGIIAYPTEGVFGLGCDPFNHLAVMRLLKLKQRAIEKGLILIAATWQTAVELTLPLPEPRMKEVFSSWPGPVTWVFPASSKVPVWISGQHSSVAIRVTAHTQAKQLCEEWGGPLVSTSANLHGETSLRDSEAVKQTFGSQIDFVLPGQVGELAGPTTILDALTGKVLR
jgi:L-threonylcarbamoyladenylate synthase